MLCTLATLVILELQTLCRLTLNPLGMLVYIHQLYVHIFGPFSCVLKDAHIMFLDFSAQRYRVFLGHKQYFVSSDVGSGKMQWYAFHKEDPGGVDAPNGMCSSYGVEELLRGSSMYFSFHL